MKPSVLILTLGGTIAMKRDSGATSSQGVKPTLTGETLIGDVPDLVDIATIQVRSFRQLPGAHLGFDDIEQLAAEIREAGAAGVDGVVIVQGTDTIEETSFALDRLLHLDAAVVVTGAMRNASSTSADGPANLVAATLVAGSPRARNMGCLVVLNEEIHAARFVRKVHSSSLGAFASPNAGPIGWVVEGHVHLTSGLHQIPALHGKDHSRSEACEGKVALVTSGLGDDGRAVDLLVDSFDGMVVQATGGGHVSPSMADALGRAAKRIPVILSSRCMSGTTLAETYGFVGSEMDLIGRGLVGSGWLDGVKSRVLLSLILRSGLFGAEEIARWFAAAQPFNRGHVGVANPSRELP